jgi:tetratricopeptide (TPR) repeat protein
MTESSSPNRARAGPFWAGLTLAAVVSIAALSLAAGPERRTAGLAPVPFGWYRVIVVHAVANLFLSWYVARMLTLWRPALAVRWKAVVWMVVGLAVGGMTVIAGGALQGFFEAFGADYLVRLLQRIVWCTVLQVPWCMAGAAAGGGAPGGRRYAIPAGHLLGLAVMTTVGVPVSYLAIFLEQQTLQAHQQWQQGQLVQAERLVQRLCDVGSSISLGTRPASGDATRPPVDVTPPMALADLKGMIALMTEQVGALAATGNSESNRLQLALGYLALDRPADAAATLAPLAERSPRAALVLAQINRQRRQFDATRRWAEKVLAIVGPPPTSEEDQDIALQAYDLLAILAGEKGDYATAERYLLEALKRLPARRADIDFRLGKHYEIAGDFPRALDHLRTAAESDPQRYEQPEGLLTKMLSTGAPVGLARPKSSRYR